MTNTKTKEIMDLLNYGLRVRESSSEHQRSSHYTSAIRDIAEIGARQNWTAEMADDFSQMLSLVSVIDRHEDYVGLGEVPSYYEQLVRARTNEKQTQMVR